MTSDNPFAYSAIYTSPVGDLGLQFCNDQLSDIEWLKPNQSYFSADDPLADTTLQYLDDYFNQAYWQKNTQLKLAGTEFQNKVWNALLLIPFGTTKTYGELATELNTSSRAVGQACKRNRIPILIPCHRVVAKDHIGGFFGKSEPSHIKEWLLAHESELLSK